MSDALATLSEQIERAQDTLATLKPGDRDAAFAALYRYVSLLCHEYTIWADDPRDGGFGRATYDRVVPILPEVASACVVGSSLGTLEVLRRARSPEERRALTRLGRALRRFGDAGAALLEPLAALTAVMAPPTPDRDASDLDAAWSKPAPTETLQ